MGELTALARERAQRYPDCKPHYHDCERDHLRCLLERLASRIESLEDERDADKCRLDWLADPKNGIGQVLLPTWCVEQNPESMRAAIDEAMGEDVK